MFRRFRKWLFWGIMLVVCGSSAVAVGQRAARWVQKENELLATAGEQTANALRSMGEAGQTFLSRAGEEQMTILFTGTNETRSELDAILLVGIDLSSDTLRAVQLPTDLYINRAKNSTHRIASVYADATALAVKRGDSQTEAVRKGNIALKGFLKDNMGIAIDHYISLNTCGLRSIIDSIGGVTVKLRQSVDYDDDARDLHIHLGAGEHSLTGDDAVDFVRYPCDGQTVNAQKLFLSAFFKKIKQEFSLSTAVSLLRAGFGNTVSDLELPDLVPLAKGMLSIEPSKVKMTPLPTVRASDESGSACNVIERQSAIELLRKNFCYQTGIDDAHFDKKRVFTAEGEIGEAYYGK